MSLKSAILSMRSSIGTHPKVVQVLKKVSPRTLVKYLLTGGIGGLVSWALSVFNFPMAENFAEVFYIALYASAWGLALNFYPRKIFAFNVEGGSSRIALKYFSYGMAFAYLGALVTAFTKTYDAPDNLAWAVGKLVSMSQFFTNKDVVFKA